MEYISPITTVDAVFQAVLNAGIAVQLFYGPFV